MWKLKAGTFLMGLAFITGLLYSLSGVAISYGGISGFFANAVGVSVGVEENAYNKIARQLEERAEELDSREESLAEMEEEIISQIKEEKRKERVALLYTFLISAVLAILLFTNFYLDWKRGKRIKKIKRSYAE
ncbi:MAG: hypothetical protein ACLFNR_00130 [Candidatus Paceibacterota bacterium]